MARKFKKTFRKKDDWERKGARIGGSIGAIASRVKNIIQELNVEHKLSQQSTNAYTLIPTSGVVINYTNIGGGSDLNQRDGNKVKVIGLTQNLDIQLSTTGFTNDVMRHTAVREILFWDSQQQASTIPTVSDVLDTAVGPAYLAPLNYQNRGRFKIIKDITHNVHNAKPGVLTRRYTKFQHHVQWQSSTSTTIQRGGIYKILVPSSDGSSVYYNIYDRLYFVDN